MASVSAHPFRRAFHAFNALTAQVDDNVQTRLGTLTSPGSIAAEDHFKGVNKDKAVIDVDVDLEDNDVTLWDTGASLDLVDASLAKVHDL